MNQSLRFDKKDRDLLRKINEVIDSGNVSSAEQETFRTALHPHGIQNMVSTHEERMAMAEVNLLQRLNDGTGVEERLSALKTLHDEVLYSAQTPFRFNTSRVLIQLMKEIVRARGNEEEQLRLLSTDGMLVKRPLVIGEDFVLVGFKESEWAETLKP